MSQSPDPSVSSKQQQGQQARSSAPPDRDPQQSQKKDTQIPVESHGHDANHDEGPVKPLSGRVALLLIFVGLGLAAVLAIVGILPRLHAEKTLAKETDDLAAPDVLTAKPTMGQTDHELILPGALQAYIDSPVYARTSGYLQRWYVDIGAHVHQGQLLAVIQSPEVDQQLTQAEADLATAQANANNAAVQSARYQNLLKDDAVSQQDTDNFVTSQASTNTQVKSAQANVARLQQLVGFERLTAPFDGVVTARDVDEGQLINAGAGSEIFHLAQTSTLRVYVAVPQIDSIAARPGVHADLTLAEFPGQHFDGKIVRTTHAIDATTRTLLAEVDVDNRKGTLMPGAYAEVHMTLQTHGNVMVIPVPAMIFRAQGLQVAVVGPDNKAKLVPITVGQDDGSSVEIVHGLGPNDEVVQNPPDSIVDGEVVHPVRQQKENQQGPGRGSGGNGSSGNGSGASGGGGAQKSGGSK